MKEITTVLTGGITITFFNKWVFVFFAKRIALNDLLKKSKEL
jgi:hypothetical protein